MNKIVVILALFFTLNQNILAQDYISPCPRLFIYEGKSPEPNRWYGIITLLSDIDLSGVWLRLAFDEPSLQLGNWFGEVSPRNENKNYVIKNRNYQLEAHVPKTVRFYVEYEPNGPIPKLVSFALNARQMCPEVIQDEVTTEAINLYTSSNLQPITKTDDKAVTDNGGDEEFFPGDFALIKYRKNEDECGTVAVQPKPLITYGHSTEEGEFPWHAAVYRVRGTNLAYICGGTLISKSHVITAGHCVMTEIKLLISPSNLSVYLGKHSLRRFSGPTIQQQTVDKIILHDDYNAKTYKNDLAVIKFSKPLDVTDYVRPVCLWQDSADLSEIINKEGKIAGWGFDESGTLSQELTKTTMPVVAQDICIFSYPDFFSRFASSQTYCAGFRNGTSVCNGDSGGGMVFPTSTSSSDKIVWQLRGLVSISTALENNFMCDTSHYVVFTDTAKYLDWITTAILK